MQKGDSSALVGPEAVRETLEVDVVAKEVASVVRDLQWDVIVLGRRVSKLCPNLGSRLIVLWRMTPNSPADAPPTWPSRPLRRGL